MTHFQWPIRIKVRLCSNAQRETNYSNTLLFRASASFDNKIKTKGLIFPSREYHIPPSKAFTGALTGSLCMILIPASCLQTVSGTISVKGK